MRQCKVFVQNRYAGLLTEKSRDEYIFTYEKEYLEDKDTMPVSLTMPKRKKPYKSDVLFPYFFNILSEGENRKMQSQWLHIDEDDDFGILMETVQYDTPGVVTVMPVYE